MLTGSTARRQRTHDQPSSEYCNDTQSPLHEVSTLNLFFLHGTNRADSLAGMETLRDIGLEEEAVKHGTLEADMGPWYRFSNTLTGGEFFRRFAFGNDPKRQVSLCLFLTSGLAPC